MGIIKHIWLFLVFHVAANGQALSVQFIPSGNYSAQKVKIPAKADSITWFNYEKTLLTKLEEEGFYSARVEKDSANWRVYVGTQSNWVIISDSTLFNGGKENALTPANVQTVNQNILQYYANRGFPFASVQLKVTQWKNDTIITQLHIEKGPKITIDSLVVKGIESLNPSIVEKFTQIKPGDLYNQSEINKANNRLNRLGYLQMTGRPAMIFSKEKNILFLYGKYNSANRFDGLIGLNTEPNGKTYFTGNLDLQLQNIFKNGESIQLAWNSPGGGSQELNIHVKWPFLFKTPLGVSLGFDLFRRDSTFANRDVQVGLSYLISPELSISMGYEWFSTNTLGTNTVMANINSAQSNWFTVGAGYKNFTGDIIPRTGWIGNFTIGQGRRSAEGVNQSVYKLLLNIERFESLYSNHHLYLQGKIKLLNGSNFYENEMYREGGIKSFRGFNEQTIITSQFMKFTLAYRYFFEKNSFFEIFNDVGGANDQVVTDQFNFLWGTGAGIGFQTKGGIFTLAYALGKTNDNDFDFRTGKVHIGYINQF